MREESTALSDANPHIPHSFMGCADEIADYELRDNSRLDASLTTSCKHHTIYSGANSCIDSVLSVRREHHCDDSREDSRFDRAISTSSKHHRIDKAFATPSEHGR